MRYLSILFILLFTAPLIVKSQTHITGIKKVADGLYVMYYDTSKEKRVVTKSTIVEFKNYIALIEMPISNDGAGATNLKDHTEGGELVLKTLHEAFPNKPLKYVLSTHWHPHSISSILPFISRGITVITTENNFKRLNEFVDSATFRKYGKYICFVGDDGMTIKDKVNRIIIYKFYQKDYPHVPTEDFLYFYLPRYQCFYSSCMFQRFTGSDLMGKELISSRVEDLNRFIVTHDLHPRFFLSTETYWDEPNGTVLNDTLQAMLKNGTLMSTAEQYVAQYDERTLLMNSDSVIKDIIKNDIGWSMVNTAVYSLLKKKELNHALALARVLILAVPSSPDYLDTYAEVHYFIGDTVMARRYAMQCKRINKDFKAGGENVWQSDLEAYQKLWAKE
jgi:hypothetical protein